MISEGHFKKHLIQCRDRGDAWAVKMHREMTAITQSCRRVQTRIAGMHTTPQHAHWAAICRDVMASAQPPTRIYTGFCQCSLTGEALDYSLDLTRAGKNNKGVYVHLRFWHWYLFLWLISKIEYIIRSVSKQWIETAQEPRESQAEPDQRRDYTALCERFRAENEPLMHQMALLYQRGQDFVAATIDLYEHQFNITPVLNPPDTFYSERAPRV